MKNTNTRKIWKYFILCLFLGFGITIPLELSLAFLANSFLNIEINIPNLIWIVVVSILIGGLVMGIISRSFVIPLTNLSAAINRVANGDFETQIETKSKLITMEEIYSNFNLMVKELNATETLQSDFVSNVSHEIKTPVTAIEGYATLLQDCDDSVLQAEYVDKIMLNTKKLSELVGNILLLSKVDNKAIQAQKHTYRLDEQIRQSIFLFESKWSEKKLELDIDMDEISYTGDENLMQHIWNNLIGNAVKFSPENGEIKLSLKKEDNRIVFTVEDNGCGIKEEEKKHIFNKFYQSDSSHKSEGNGLGLALVKNILNLCKGEISVENGEKGGAKFTVRL